MSTPPETVHVDTLPAAPIAIDNPYALLAKAIDAGADPERLGRLVDLVEHVAAGQARAAYNQAMNACQAELPCVCRDATNPHTKSKFARLETVMSAAKSVLARHGFSLSWSELPETKEGLLSLRCDVRHIGGHVEPHYGHFPRDGQGAKGGSIMSPIQGTGSTMTYARRYMLLSIFNVVVADQDLDGNSHEQRVTPEQIAHINALVDQREAQGVSVNFQRMISWLIQSGHLPAGAENLEQLSVTGYKMVIVDMERKIREHAAKEAKP